MAPFPEEEIMTIKRLEVALRKSDFKLLKEGAYKLHEKYHSHHHFEYLDLLKIILDEVQTNYAIPSDIKDILIMTIQDILSNNPDEVQNRVSSLTSLSYGVNNQPEENQAQEDYTPKTLRPVEMEQEHTTSQESYMKPFQEFTPLRPIEMVPENNPQEEKTDFEEVKDNQDSKSIVNSYNGGLYEDFDTQTPVVSQQNIFEESTAQTPQMPQESISYLEPTVNSQEKVEYVEVQEPQEYLKNEEEPKEYLNQPEEIIQEEQVQEEIQEENNFETEYVEPQQEIVSQTAQEEQATPYSEIPAENYRADEESSEAQEEVEEPAKTIAIFFAQDSSEQKSNNIAKYRNLLNAHSNFTLDEITSLINEIKTQADTKVFEIQTILEQLKRTKHKLSLLTNSQSANLVDLLNQSDISYEIYNETTDKRVNLLPLFGLTNLYKCIECNNEYLQNNEINSYILQCPKCKKAMLPDLYSAKTEVNMDYYNSSIVALANSEIWLLVHPSLNEKLTLDMIRSSAKVSSKLKEVYILDKDINIRETYRKIFEEINPEINVSSDVNVIADFLNNI